MKTQYKFLALFLLTISLLTIASCKKLKNPTDGVQVIINYDLIETNFSVKFIDAATGELIGQNGDKKVNIKIGGQHADAVIDVSGLQKPEYESSNGFVELALNPNTDPSQQNPVKFTIVASADGYLSTSKFIEIGGRDRLMFEMRMVDVDNPPNGVSRIIDNSGEADPEGRIVSDITVNTPNGNASLRIPSGTILKSESGELLTGGIEIQLTHFSNMEDGSLQSFPGGLNTNVEQADGSYERALFFSAGFVALEIMDETGTLADTVLVNPLELTMQVPEQTFNPNSEGGVSAGDTIPVWSYNENTGEWNYEATDVINTGSRESYQVTTEMWHLSWWNWDWPWWWVCYEGLIIHFESDEYYCPCYWWNVQVRNPFNNTLMWNTYMYACQNDPVHLWNAPGGLPVNMYFSDQCGNVNTELDFYYEENLCAADELWIYFYAEEMGQTVEVDISAYCASNPDYIIRPTLSYWVREANDWCFRWFELVNGHGELCGVELGETYVIGIYLDGKWYEHTFTIDQSYYVEHGIELPPEVCSEVFGL
ncbi:MAG: hypothetical protein K9G67_14610 [Bacteroidales bacterium]|nr:hypothetical protein [Bacteroidales bacterium]MCF8351283.1 hypothetical protein [Bacteroidales bacterium]MCF8377584.1 hypothetical protein [Bacteroidales bacterium]MCF8401835.1 hypothetical protein [Bacteroidales bacterium]